MITICLVLFVSATLLFETLLGYWYRVIVKKSKFFYAGSLILISRCRSKKKNDLLLRRFALIQAANYSLMWFDLLL